MPTDAGREIETFYYFLGQQIQQVKSPICAVKSSNVLLWDSETRNAGLQATRPATWRTVGHRWLAAR